MVKATIKVAIGPRTYRRKLEEGVTKRLLDCNMYLSNVRVTSTPSTKLVWILQSARSSRPSAICITKHTINSRVNIARVRFTIIRRYLFSRPRLRLCTSRALWNQISLQTKVVLAKIVAMRANTSAMFT